jgi:hypothetical protein
VNRAALRSTVDSRQWRPERLAGAAEPGSSLRVGEKGEELYGGGVLTEGFGGRFNDEARPVIVKGEQWR